jgi:hypothetical protein
MPSLAETQEQWFRIQVEARVFLVVPCRYRPSDGLIAGPQSPTDCLQDSNLKINSKYEEPRAPNESGVGQGNIGGK